MIERFHFWRESPDILAILKPQMAAEWIALMIIIDMLVYGNVVNFAKTVNLMFILYAVMTLGMFYRRNGKMEPVLLVIPIFLFALVKLNRERMEWFLKRFTDSWFLIFVYVCVRSFREKPFTGRRLSPCIMIRSLPPLPKLMQSVRAPPVSIVNSLAL